MDADWKRAIKIVLLCTLVALLILASLLSVKGANTISSASATNGSSFELTSSSWYQPVTSNVSISTSAGTTIIVATVEARMSSTGAKLLGRILRDGVEINRVNLTESAYITNIPIVAVHAETEGTHYYALELLNPAGKKTFVNNWTLGVTYIANGAYITEGITNATALINISQVALLQLQQDAQNASTVNLQYNSTVYDAKFNNTNITDEGLKVNDTTHDTKFNNQNTTNAELRINDTTHDAKFDNVNSTYLPNSTFNSNFPNNTLPIFQAYLNNSFPGSIYITTLGTIVTGLWHGTAIEDVYVASSALWNSYVGKIDANNASISNLQYNSTVTDQKFNNTNASLVGINNSINGSNYNDTVHDQKFNNVNTSIGNVVANNTAQANYDNVTFLTITTANSMNDSSHNNRTYFQGVTDSINNTKANKSEVVGTVTTDQMNSSSANNRTYFQVLADLFNLTFASQATNNSNVNASFASQTINNSNFNVSLSGINDTLALQAVNNSNFNTSLAQIVVNSSAQADYDNATFVKTNNGSYVQTNNGSYVKTNNMTYLKNTSVTAGANTTVLDNGDGTITISSSGNRLETVQYFNGDGMTLNFTTSSAIQTTTSRVYLNGIRQKQGATGSYIEHSPFIEFASAPPLYDLIEVEYV